MIKLRVRQLAEERGWNIQQVANHVGVAYTTALDLWRDNAQRIDKKTLDRLCRAFGVMPGDLFDYQPDEQAS